MTIPALRDNRFVQSIRFIVHSITDSVRAHYGFTDRTGIPK